MDSISEIMSLNSLESAMQVEESELLNQMLLSNDQSLFFSGSDYFSSQDANSNLWYFSQESYSTIDASSFFDPLRSYQALDTCVSDKNVEEFTTSSDLFDVFDQQLQPKRKVSIDEVEKATEENNSLCTSMSDVKKKAKVEVKDKKNVDIAPNIRSSSSSISEVELDNDSKEDKISNALNLNVRKRTSRASAIDPQNLYAKRRRARINERLRILQNLVPNGTKVDISTMLEEAVQYVKFLQLQIKVLSSDDKWMYAPLAYNGINIGLDLNRDLP